MWQILDFLLYVCKMFGYYCFACLLLCNHVLVFLHESFVLEEEIYKFASRRGGLDGWVVLLVVVG